MTCVEAASNQDMVTWGPLSRKAEMQQNEIKQKTTKKKGTKGAPALRCMPGTSLEHRGHRIAMPCQTLILQTLVHSTRTGRNPKRTFFFPTLGGGSKTYF